ncbi:hypothetical protein HRbin11_00607 [bacterium HR11]|nr:hypothetical protein HRbin11_00607 [bacterium HR11]
MKPWALLSVLVVLLLQVQPPDPVRYPPPGAHLLSSRVVVVAEAEDIQTTGSVLKKVRTDAFVHLILALPAGKHELRLVTVQKGQVRRQTRAVHVFPSRHYPDVPPYAFHDDAQTLAVCAGCHSDGTGTEACLRCHTDKTGQAEVPHEGYDPKDCGTCHAKGTGPAPAAACAECHEAVTGRLHAPYAVGDCRLCHDPHGAARKRLLTAEIPELCAQCHRAEDYREAVHPVAQHPIESRGLTCVSCHQPHGGPFPGYLRWAPEVFCDQCHKGS